MVVFNNAGRKVLFKLCFYPNELTQRCIQNPVEHLSWSDIQQLTILAKSSFSDARPGSKHASVVVCTFITISISRLLFCLHFPKAAWLMCLVCSFNNLRQSLIKVSSLNRCFKSTCDSSITLRNPLFCVTPF